MVACASCGKQISTAKGPAGIRERDQVYHINCAPDDLLADALSEWDAILDRGLTYFVKKYSTSRGGGLRGRQAYVGLFSEMGRSMAAESKKRKK